MILLNRENLPKLASLGIEVPNYPRDYQQRICHIGVGGFHRAHQAFYLHKLLQQQKGNGWGICGIGLMPADKILHNVLIKQDFLYSVWALGPSSREISVIGSIMDYVDASEHKQDALNLLADAVTKIVSLTITEKGYCLQKNGELDTTNALIAADLNNFDHPVSAIGLITKALAMRRALNIQPFTVMSCDNLIENGHQARKAVISFAKQIDSLLAKWIEEHVAFPLSMVDRITPVPQKTRMEILGSELGIQDDGLLVCEDWLQWVLEDHFSAGRPSFELVGVQMTNDVKPYENMKVGLLNGSHSALSYYGLLKGYVRVDEAVSDHNIQQWLRKYMKQIEAALKPVEGINFSEYEDALISRFSNKNIEDNLSRLAEDGSAKFQQALVPALKIHLDLNSDIRFIASAIANWVVYLNKLKVDKSAEAQYRDPMKDELIELASTGIGNKDLSLFCKRALGLSDVHATRFSTQLLNHIQGINRDGVDIYNSRL